MAFLRRYHDRWQLLANNGRCLGWFTDRERAEAACAAVRPEEENTLAPGDRVWIDGADGPFEAIVRGPCGHGWYYQPVLPNVFGPLVITVRDVRSFAGRDDEDQFRG